MVVILVALVAWALPVGFAWGAWQCARGSLTLIREGVRTTGPVVVKGTRVITIEYSVGGRSHRVETSWWYLDTPMGGAVPIVYLASAPDRGCVAHWTDLWMPVFLWTVPAVFFAILDIWY